MTSIRETLGIPPETPTWQIAFLAIVFVGGFAGWVAEHQAGEDEEARLSEAGASAPFGAQKSCDETNAVELLLKLRAGGDPAAAQGCLVESPVVTIDSVVDSGRHFTRYNARIGSQTIVLRSTRTYINGVVRADTVKLRFAGVEDFTMLDGTEGKLPVFDEL